MIVRTMNSTYEIDPDAKRIRRVFGTNPATPRLGEEWKSYRTISDPVVGESLSIVWAIEDVSLPDRPEVLFRTTVTSKVCEVLDVPLRHILN